jgi:hypothetical protein
MRTLALSASRHAAKSGFPAVQVMSKAFAWQLALHSWPKGSFETFESGKYRMEAQTFAKSPLQVALLAGCSLLRSRQHA